MKNIKGKMEVRKEILPILFLFGLLSMFILSSIFVSSESMPEGPTSFEILNSSRRTPEVASGVSAIAGNVTQLNIVGTTITQTWVGYYGNISGTITLDNSQGNSLFDWDLASPEGEIYASVGEIDFSDGNIICFNYSPDVIFEYTSLSELETSLGLDTNDVDGVNETFVSGRTHNSFYSGVNFIDGSDTKKSCPMVRLLNGTGEETQGRFEELLLYDKTSHNPIYTAIIENDVKGFTNETVDFQMIVAEDGHSGDTNPTTYYFYVELE